MSGRNTIPAEDCVFRLDYRNGFRQAYPMTFNNVGLSEDGFEFDGESSYIKIGTELHLNDFTNNEHWSLGSMMSGEEAFGNIIVDKLKMYRDIITPTQVKHISAQMMRKIGRQ